MAWSVSSGHRTSRWTIVAVVVAVVCLVIALVSCSSGRGGAAEAELPGTHDATAKELAGHTFVSATVEGKDLVPASSITMTFTEDTLSANAGCNTMSGGYTIDGGTLQVGALAQTMMACSDELNAQEQWVAAFLAAGPDAQVGNETLTLEHDGTKIIFAESTMSSI